MPGEVILRPHCSKLSKRKISTSLCYRLRVSIALACTFRVIGMCTEHRLAIASTLCVCYFNITQISNFQTKMAKLHCIGLQQWENSRFHSYSSNPVRM